MSEYNSSGRNRVNGLLLVLVLLGLGGLLVPFFLPPPAILELVLADAIFGLDLAGRPVLVTETATGWSREALITSDGSESLASLGFITNGERNFVVTVEGYEPSNLAVAAQPRQLLRELVLLNPRFGQLRARLFDASDSKKGPPAGVTVRVQDQELHPEGGEAVFQLEPGGYTVAAAAPRYCGLERGVRIEKGKVSLLSIPLPPEPTGADRARIILDWAEVPRDLDAHVLLSDPSQPSANRHVSFRGKQGRLKSGRLFAELDVDWVHSEGFETITVYDRVEGVYQYFVHNFSNDGTLGQSGAAVELFTVGCKVRRFEVSEDCTSRWWYVADLRVTDQEVLIIERGNCPSKQPFPWDQREKD
jgi:hypothetical protein